MDVRAFLGLDGRARVHAAPGDRHVSSLNAAQEQPTQLCHYVQEPSPVRGLSANAVPVETSMKTK